MVTWQESANDVKLYERKKMAKSCCVMGSKISIKSMVDGKQLLQVGTIEMDLNVITCVNDKHGGYKCQRCWRYTDLKWTRGLVKDVWKSDGRGLETLSRLKACRNFLEKTIAPSSGHACEWSIQHTRYWLAGYFKKILQVLDWGVWSLWEKAEQIQEHHICGVDEDGPQSFSRNICGHRDSLVYHCHEGTISSSGGKG